MFYRLVLCVFLSSLLCAVTVLGTIFSHVRGVVHDPQHLPIAGAQVTLRATSSDWSRETVTNSEGVFEFATVPLGDYQVTIAASGFVSLQQKFSAVSGSSAILHFPMKIVPPGQTVTVSEQAQNVDAQSSAVPVTIGRGQIDRMPGADQSNSLAMITDYVPGAYIVHDLLHVRGGHQVSWLVDGVPVPNTNIASNVGPQFDPKDVDYIEVRRGGLSADYGDRTYGAFNVVPRSGFEFNRDGEIRVSYGNFNTTNDQISFGDHTQRFAYYFSLNANRSDLGLETPTSDVIHDIAAGGGFFASLFYNITPQNQLRLVASARGDHYQIPNAPDQQSAGTRDLDLERDAFVNLSWIHTMGSGVLLTVSPYYHFNRANYEGGAGDLPVIPQQENTANYAGLQSTLSVVKQKHNARFGVDVFGERQNDFFGLVMPGSTASNLAERVSVWGNHEAIFLEDQFRLTSWLTLNGGVRLTRFAGDLTETSVDPRVGGALRLPRLGWVLRGFYGRYYQAPPLVTIEGPILSLAASQGFGFLPLHGERDEQHEFGLTIPIRAWTVDVANFRTAARNFLDHDVLGNSNIFLPLTLQRARIRGWESTVRSPRLLSRVNIHLAYSHQFAEGRGSINGGLTDFSPPVNRFFFLDHDQRNTLSTGFDADLPGKMWLGMNVSYGSGFLDGDGPQHLASHATADISLGKSFGKNWSISAYMLNLADRRYLLDNSNTFGGTHFANPRQAAVEIRYRFHF
ncbi:MAG: TonB-dependent receptor [Acidobacteriia bacterium]|nr:TonB-dependent receptor [Terriglobia bacterium]